MFPLRIVMPRGMLMVVIEWRVLPGRGEANVSFG